MDTQQPAVSRASILAPPRRHRRRAWFVLLLCLAGAWLARFTYLRITLKPTPRTEYWSAQLAALDPAPAGCLTQLQIEDVLGAFDYLSADPRVASPQFDTTSILDGAWDHNRGDIQTSINLMENSKFNEAREKVSRGVRAGWQEQVNLTPNALLPLLSKYRQNSKWLVSHSRYAREEKRDVKTAVDDWLLALGVARQVRRQQLMLPWLVATAIENLVMSEVLEFAHEEFGSFDVKSFTQEVERIEETPRTARVMLNGEKLYLMALLDSCFITRGGDWLDVSEFIGNQHYTGSLYSTFTKTSAPARIWNITSPLFHDYATARNKVEAVFANYESCNTLSATVKLDEMKNEPGFQLDILDGVWDLSHLPRFVYLIIRGELETKGALASLAIKEFHIRHGTYPATLQELVPEFLSRVPIDRADNQPLRYRRTSDGYLLYSVGKNGIDDGGKSIKGQHLMFDENPDIVFSHTIRGEYKP